MTDLAVPGMAYAFAEWGMWKACCPRPGCTNAMMLLRDQLTFSCLGPHSCGLEAPITWPADPDAIEAVLAMRPLPANQNWLPGETIEDLLVENAAHDCLDPDLLALAVGPRAVLVRTVGQRVVGGLLHQQLEAARRREIGD
jgi:hypothetical protein